MLAKACACAADTRSERGWRDHGSGGRVFLGELSLDGGLRHTHGILPMVALARDRRVEAVYVPAMDAPEAALVEDVTVYPVASLAQLMAHLRGDERIQPYLPDASLLEPQDDSAYPYACLLTAYVVSGSDRRRDVAN
jgi:predicted ATPase with chaperone activity